MGFCERWIGFLLVASTLLVCCLGGNLNSFDLNSKQINIQTSFTGSSENEDCKVEISFLGNGVKDKFLEKCYNHEFDAVINDALFILGNPRKNHVAFYSDQPNTLIVIKNKLCSKKYYRTTNSVTNSVRILMTVGKCNELKNKIAEILKTGGQNKIQLNKAQPVAPNGGGSITFTPTSAVNSQTQSLYPAVNEFKPPLPFRLRGKQNKDRYVVSVSQMVDILNRKGCFNYVWVQGKGVLDHFLVTCFKGATSVESQNIMTFGQPTSPLGLFSDTPSTLVILNDGVCFEKRYNPPTAPTFMDTEKCKKVKQKMAEVIRKSPPHNLDGGFEYPGFRIGDSAPGQPVDETASAPIHANDVAGQSFGVSGGEITAGSTGTNGMFNNFGNDDVVYSSPPSGDVTTGVTWRKGEYNKVSSNSFSVSISKDKGGKCQIDVLGRGLNDAFNHDCDKLGDKVQKIMKNNILVVADPSKDCGLYADTFNELVIVKDYKCYKREYEMLYNTGNTKIIPRTIGDRECEEVKEIMSSYLGANFGKPDTPTTFDFESTSSTPMWRKGEFNKVRSESFAVSINKNNEQCKVDVLGRGVNDEFVNSCDIIGKNIEKIIKNHILVVADPTKSFGLFTDTYNELVVVKNGRCYSRKYETLHNTGNTKVTQGSINSRDCENVKETMSSFLGVNFGVSETADPAALKKTWQKGTWSTTKSSTFTVRVNRVNGQPGQCEMFVVGRGVNDHIQNSCTVMGEAVKQVVKNHMLVVADPSKLFGLFTDTYDELVVFDNGQCSKREYETFSDSGNTKVTWNPMSTSDCKEVQETMSAYLGANFAQTETDHNSMAPIWRKGEYSKVKSGSFSVSINKNGKQCKISILGRGVNDELTNSFDKVGENVQKIIRGHVLVVADPTKTFGLYSDTYDELVVVDNGQCSLREYETSSITDSTKITYGSVSDADCRDVKETMSSYLGTNFGHTEPADRSTAPIWRQGTWSTTKAPTFSVRVTKVSGQPDQCGLIVVGRGVNDYLQNSCSALGNDIQQFTRNNILVIADPTKNFGVFSDSYDELVVYDNGVCTKREHMTSSDTGNTRITPSLMTANECRDVQETISSYLGANFGQTDTDPNPVAPMWRKGTYLATKSPSFSVKVKKVSGQPDQCEMFVVGRGVNDHIKNSCSAMGNNIKQVARNHILVVADPAKDFGVFSDSYDELVVFNSGQCIKREHATSSETGNTRITGTPMSAEECRDVREAMSSYLGVDFGRSQY